MRTSEYDVLDWIEELKKRGIREFQYKDLPDDLKRLNIIRKAKSIDKIKEKIKIRGLIVWTVE